MNPILRVDRNGFRLRGEAVTRLETFIDAAFAFAVTLLVIVVGTIPQTFSDFAPVFFRVPAFAASFAIIALYWSAHDRFSRRFGLEDTRTRGLGLALVFVLLVYVYPLRVIMSLGMHYASGQWLPTDLVVKTVQDLQIAFIVYAVGAIALSGIIAALNRHALNTPIEPPLNARERLETRYEIYRFYISIGVSTASIVVALFELLVYPTPDWRAGLPGILYAVYGLLMPRYHTALRRARAALAAETA